MAYITKNHKTATTILVAVAALAAILVAAGTIATAPGSYHSAFAHKNGANKSFENSGIALPTITAQKQKCENNGGGATDSLGYVTVIGSQITGSCIATSTNTVTESGGAVK
jgi:hypothetical protein